MVEASRLICPGADLAEGGKGVRFEISTDYGTTSGFAIRHAGHVHAYVNRCAHIGIELDWLPGEFFDESGLYLVCATHGATYLPDSGECIAGPCRGAQLARIDVMELNGGVYLK